MTSSRKLALFSVFMLAVIGFLVGLGLWQLDRRVWKEGVIAQIEARAKAEPLILDAALAEAARSGSPDYLRLTLSGRYHHDMERHYYMPSQGTPGWRVITPLETGDGRFVLVDRGFVPDRLKQPAARPEGQTEGPVTLTGLARQPGSQGLFSPDNQPDANQWFWRDLPGMAGSVLPQGADIVPFFIEAEESGEGGWPRGGESDLALPNNHLQYALTWFGLAIVLTGLYFLYLRKELKGRP
jgi:surfeit locus 1 family protein